MYPELTSVDQDAHPRPGYVLYVDADQQFRDLVTTQLETAERQFTVETAATAEEGLNRLHDGVDCVVSTYRLPDTDGVDFLETVREQHPKLPFILFVDEGSESIASAAISAGVSGYLHKESDRAQIESLVSQIRDHATDSSLDTQDPYLELAGLGYWRFDVATDQLYWSDGLREFFGLSDEDLVSYEQFLEYVHPNDTAAVETQWKEVLDGGYDTEFRVVTADGESRWLRDRATVDCDADETPVSVYGVVQDITEQREQGENLTRFRRAIEASAHSVYITDTDGIIEYVNPEFERTTGYSAEEATGNTLQLLTSSVHDEEFYEQLWETVRSGETWTDELVTERKNGEQYVVKQTIVPVTNSEGTTTHFVFVNTDITEIKEHQSELRRLWQAVEKAHAPLTLSDPKRDDNPIVYANEAFTEVTGYSDDDIIGHNCRMLQGAETDPETVAELREAIENEEQITVEIQNYRKDGTTFWNELTVTPIYDSDGELVRFLGTQQEITERKEREKHLDVLDRVLRHNLRNDLSVIYSLAETIQSAASGEIASAAASITEKSTDIVDTADKQRTITRLLRDRPTRTSVHIGSLVDRIVTKVAAKYPAATITVDTDGDTTATAVARIDLAIRELVTNAVEHNDQESPRVSVSVTGLEDWVRIEVADNGPLIPEMERQLGADGTELDPLYHGSGLGLWLVYWVVSRSNGSVVFTTSEVGGNRIQVNLPRDSGER